LIVGCAGGIGYLAFQNAETPGVFAPEIWIIAVGVGFGQFAPEERKKAVIEVVALILVLAPVVSVHPSRFF